MENNRATGLPCPHCAVDLVMSERQGIEIDFCPKCRGVWLDRGELDKIIERGLTDNEHSAPPAAPALGYGEELSGGYRESGHGGHGGSHGGHGGRKGKHGSFLSRLFD